MHRPALLWIPAVIFLLAGTACRRSAPAPTPPAATTGLMDPGSFITKPGTLHYLATHTHIQLDLKQSGGRVDWNFHYLRPSTGSRTYGSGMALPTPDCQTWFLYMEDDTTFWMYDGGSVLRYYSLEDSGPKSGSVMRDGKLEQGDRKPPDDVILKLPPEQQKLFPPLPTPAKRPSI